MKNQEELREMLIKHLMDNVVINEPFRIRELVQDMDLTDIERSIILTNISTWSKGEFPALKRIGSMISAIPNLGRGLYAKKREKPYVPRDSKKPRVQKKAQVHITEQEHTGAIHIGNAIPKPIKQVREYTRTYLFGIPIMLKVRYTE